MKRILIIVFLLAVGLTAKAQKDKNMHTVTHPKMACFNAYFDGKQHFRMDASKRMTLWLTSNAEELYVHVYDYEKTAVPRVVREIRFIKKNKIWYSSKEFKKEYLDRFITDACDRLQKH